MSYIRTIAPQAREFGIAKIVPPETWRMPFVTDTEVSEIFFPSVVIEVPKGREQGANGTLFLEIQVHDTAAAP
jgi:hypothetical protein